MIPVRPLRPEDVEHLLALLAASADRATAGGNTAGQAAGWNRRAFEDILANPEQGSCLLTEQDDAEHDGIVTGFACFRVTATEAELLNLAVLPLARRQGTGSRLLEHILQEAACRGAERIFLEVRESNVAAWRLYERFGFQPVGRRRGYYTQPAADAIILRRCLSPPTHAASHRLAGCDRQPDHWT